jgi:hypothetical protein
LRFLEASKCWGRNQTRGWEEREGELHGHEDGTEARKGAVASLARSDMRRPRENPHEINDLLIHASGVLSSYPTPCPLLYRFSLKALFKGHF